ncbi:MAG TPA: TniB family NTP-binding protein [Terracidiphilus sp.]|jgi:replication-associated recombination protein RarA
MTPALDHLQPPFRPIALQPAAERIHWIQQDRWIHYTRAEEALKRIAGLLACPPRNRMPCLLLTGAPGMGKTHIIQKFVRDHPCEFDAVTGTTRTRVAAMQMPPEPLEKDFYDEMLIAMGAVVSASSSMVSVRSRARTFARQFGLRLLIIDEIHAMLAGTFRQQRIFLNSIRFLANDLPLLCIGTHEAHQALLTDQQLADRFAAFELPHWQDDSAFAQLLKTFAAILPLRSPSDLCQPKLRQRILSLTEGVTVRICRVLEAAAIAAITDGAECIGIATLSDELGARSLVSISDRRRGKP